MILFVPKQKYKYKNKKYMETLNKIRTDIIKKDVKNFESELIKSTNETVKFIIEELKKEKRLPFNTKSSYWKNVCASQKLMIAIGIFNEKLKWIIQNNESNNNNEEFRKIS